MKIIPIASDFQGDSFDAARPLAEYLISTGAFKAFVPMAPPRRPQDVSWSASPPVNINGVLEPPYISFHCHTCAYKGAASGGTAHETQIVRCCGGVSKCPDDIAEKYKEYWKQYEPKRRRALDAQFAAKNRREEFERKVQEQERALLATKLRLPDNDD